MLKARQAAEIEPQLLILSSKGILRGPIRPFETRSIRMLNDGSDVGDGCRVGARSNRGAGLSRPRFGFINSNCADRPERTGPMDIYSNKRPAPDSNPDARRPGPRRSRRS